MTRSQGIKRRKKKGSANEIEIPKRRWRIKEDALQHIYYSHLWWFGFNAIPCGKTGEWTNEPFDSLTGIILIMIIINVITHAVDDSEYLFNMLF